MPELPQMQALAERLDVAVAGAVIARVELLGFSGLKTVLPPGQGLEGEKLLGVGRRGKYLVLNLSSGRRALVHLSQAGRLDIEVPPKHTKPRGAVVRFVLRNDTGVLVREHGHERKAGWWLRVAGGEGPLEGLGPEPPETAFEDLLLTSQETRHLHTLLRDQRFVAGIGRGYSVTEKVAEVKPCATVTEAGTLAAEAFELESDTTAPPEPAAAVRVTVPVLDWPLTTDPGDTETLLSATARGFTVSAAVLLTLA